MESVTNYVSNDLWPLDWMVFRGGMQEEDEKEEIESSPENQLELLISLIIVNSLPQT